MASTRQTFCRICESVCGLDVSVAGDRVVGIRPNARHVGSDGFACIKGLNQHKMFSSPDRLRHPERRVGDRWERVSWQQALSDIGARVSALRETREPDSSHNSWTHNIEQHVGSGTNHLYLHPADAARLGLADGDAADVSTRVATVRVPVKLLPDLMPGTVALPHGWGHQHATGLSVASRTRGVNVNLLAADGPDALESVSGMANLTGFEVEVRPAAGPLDPSSWSGIAPSPLET